MVPPGWHYRHQRVAADSRLREDHGSCSPAKSQSPPDPARGCGALYRGLVPSGHRLAHWQYAACRRRREHRRMNRMTQELELDCLDQLEATPAILRGLMCALSVEDTEWKPAPGRFSVAEVLAHPSHSEGHFYRTRVDRFRSPIYRLIRRPRHTTSEHPQSLRGRVTRRMSKERHTSICRSSPRDCV